LKVLKAVAWLVGFLVLLVAGVGLAYVIAPLPVFNALMLKDAGAKLVARDVAYGPDKRQQYNLFAPESGKNFPLLVFVHGGGWDSGNKAGYDFVGHGFAAKGYLTAVIEYRLVPDVHYPVFVEDTVRAVAHLRAQAASLGGDASRVYLVGHSAGAYNIVQAMLDPAYAVDMKFVRAASALAGPYDFLPLNLSPLTQRAFGQHPKPEDTQPATHLRADQPPLLLLHGTDDDLVPPGSSQTFYGKVIAAGARAEIKLFPNTNHISILGDLSRPFRYRSTTYADTIAFFEKHP
jgi:acetyl esterase/lipase